ncbi:PAS domain S-box protein [Marinobacter sediminum]|uniref:hybrid sensor histidine kinase/response regulator n=1 Tax=Marinobacter sediminum TaxID=256323 RepID=UPI003568D33F
MISFISAMKSVEDWHPSTRVCAVTCLIAAVFAADFFTPKSFAHGLLYLPAILLAARNGGEWFARAVLIACVSGTIAAGVLMSGVEGDGVSLPNLGNRMLACLILLSAYFYFRRTPAADVSPSTLSRQDREQLMHFATLTEHLPVQVWTATPAGKVDHVGEKLADFTGKSHQVILEDWLGFLHPDDQQATLDAWLHSVETGELYDVNFRIRRSDGRYIWHKTQASPVYDSQGRIERWLGTTFDIDDLVGVRQSASALAESFRETLESITDAFLTLDSDCRLTYANSKAAEILGVSVDEMLGNVIWACCDMASDGPFGLNFRRAMAERRQISFEEYFEPSQLWLGVRVYPAGNGGLTIYLLDITETKREREQLMLLNKAVSRLSDIIMITDARSIQDDDPKLVFVNDAFVRTTGYTREEMLGQSPRCLLGPNSQRSERDRILRALENRVPVRSELIKYKKSGEEYWADLELVPVANDQGEYSHWVSVERDITDKKRLQEKLAIAQNMESVSRFVGGLAEDFSALLSGVRDDAEALYDRLRLVDPEIAELTDRIGLAVSRGAALTSNMLAFGRKQRLEPQVTQMTTLLDDIAPVLRATAGAGNHVSFDVSPDTSPVMVDAGQLENCLINLTLNAREAMPEGGSIGVSCRNVWFDAHPGSQEQVLRSGRYVRISFSDTGIGMSEHLRSRIFDPFFSTKETEGAGLGLSTVYGFLAQSGGHISVYSEPGMGSVFHLYLPESAGDEQTCASEHEDMAAQSSGSILVVDDNADIRNVATKILTRRGYSVRTAENGDHAWALIEEGFRPALVFSDIVMPGTRSGLDLCKQVQSRYPDIGLLLASGFAEVQTLHDQSSLGRIPVLAKPYRKVELIEMVERTMQEAT